MNLNGYEFALKDVKAYAFENPGHSEPMMAMIHIVNLQKTKQKGRTDLNCQKLCFNYWVHVTT